MLNDNPGSSSLKRIGVFFIDLLADYFPFLLIFIIIAGFSAAFYLNRIDYAVRGFLIGMPAIMAACSLIKMRSQDTLDGNIELLNADKYLLPGLFITMYLFSISSAIISPTRPWYYFILIVGMFCLIGIQIFSSNQNQNLILFEILGLTMNLSYSIVLKYPLYFGWTDTIYLIGMAKVTLLSGYVIPPDLVTGGYTHFPLYHIYLAEISSILGLDLQTVLFTVMIIPYAIIIFFIFKISYQITNNQQLSLLVCLVYSAMSVVIFYATYIQTRVMAYIGFIILLYIFFKGINSGRSGLSYRILFFLTLIYIILVHQVSVFQIIPILVVLFITEWIVSDRKVIRPELIATIIVMAFSYWMYGASEYFMELFSRLNIFGTTKVMMVKSSVQTGNEWEFLFSNLDTAIVVFFVLCGIGYLLFTKRNNYLVIFALFGLVMLPFFVPNPLQMLWTSMILFRADRMMLLLAPFFAFLMAWGIYIHLNLFEKYAVSKKVSCCILIAIIFSFTFLSLTLTNASDSEDIFWATEKYYFDRGEISGLNFIFNSIPVGSTISSDAIVERYFGIYRWFSETEELDLPFYKISGFNYTGSSITGKGYLVVRSKEFENNGLVFTTQIEGDSDRLLFSQENQNKMNLMYDLTDRLYDSRYIIVTRSSANFRTV